MILLILVNLFVLSFFLNVYLVIKAKNKKQAKIPSIELKDFLTDVAKGGGLLKVERIDPTSVFLYRPEDL